MWSRTDLHATDVNVAEIYDGFTFLTFAWLEALGFCADGEAGPFVDGATRIALDGELPLNTYGGQLSAGRMHGYWLLHEACLWILLPFAPCKTRRSLVDAANSCLFQDATRSNTLSPHRFS